MKLLFDSIGVLLTVHNSSSSWPSHIKMGLVSHGALLKVENSPQKNSAKFFFTSGC